MKLRTSKAISILLLCAATIVLSAVIIVPATLIGEYLWQYSLAYAIGAKKIPLVVTVIIGAVITIAAIGRAMHGIYKDVFGNKK